MRLLSYDSDRHDLAGAMRAMLNVADLAALRAGGATRVGISLYRGMEETSLHRRCVARLTGDDGAELRRCYDRFVAEVIDPLFEDQMLVQRVPTPRILFADAGGEPRFHRDADYGHDPREINIFLPLTDCFGSNTIWVEGEPGRGDHRPVELRLGQFMVFDGASLSHGAVANTTGASRVSLDFRIIAAASATARHLIVPPTESLTLDPRVFRTL